MASEMAGLLDWSGERDEYGYRSYTITFRVVTNNVLDGPAVVMQTPGLPRPGSWYFLGNDIDIYVWTRLNLKVTPTLKSEPNTWWEVEVQVSNKPPDRKEAHNACTGQEIQDPLLTPQKVSGSMVKRTEESVYDRFGNRISNSAQEQLHGPNVQFDQSQPQIRIEQNVPFLDLANVQSMVNSVNAFPMWGLDARMIKLSEFTWERKFWGQCLVYYTRNFTFDIRYDTWDRIIADEGTQVIKGEWDTKKGSSTKGQYKPADDVTYINIGGQNIPDYTNLANFQRYQDAQGHPAKTLLNGAGMPANYLGDPNQNQVAQLLLSVYQEADFTILGIPLVF